MGSKTWLGLSEQFGKVCQVDFRLDCTANVGFQDRGLV